MCMLDQGLVDLNQAVVTVVLVLKVQVVAVVEGLNQAKTIVNHRHQQQINQQVQLVTQVELKHQLSVAIITILIEVLCL